MAKKECAWGFFFFFLACLAATGGAASPAADCSNAILSLSDCLSFVQEGTKVGKPQGTCCSALKTVVKNTVEAKCLCEAFKSSAQYGLSLNMTKALSLPSACKVSTPSFATCKVAAGPGAAPAPSPSQFFSNAPVSSPSSATGGSARSIPAPSPMNSSARALSIPATIVLLLMWVLLPLPFESLVTVLV